jgi:hypothetical protein
MLDRVARQIPKNTTWSSHFIRNMSSSGPPYRPFRLALIQMGVTSNKEQNLAHARELVLKASNPPSGDKPGVIVLPVRLYRTAIYTEFLSPLNRSALIHRMGMYTSPITRKRWDSRLVKSTISPNRKAIASKCSLRQPRRQELG